MSWVRNRSLSVVIRVQLFVILIAVIIFLGFFNDIDTHVLVSVMLGGGVGVISSLAFAVIVSGHEGFSASGVIRTALRAEAIRIILIVVLLWIVFKNYENVNAIAFIGAFTLTVLIHSMALFVPSNAKQSNDKINL